jgi:hypothetical protein
MIKISDRFSISRSGRCWTVYERSLGTHKGKPIERVKKTYHSSMQRSMEHIRDIECGDCETLEQILAILRKPI